MKNKVIKIVSICVFLLIIGILVVPQFTLAIGEFKFNFPNINLKSLGLNSILGDFQRGYGIFPGQQIKAEIIFPENKDDNQQYFKESVNRIKERLINASITEISVFGEAKNDKYFLVLEAPNYYPDFAETANWLFFRGEISFNVFTVSEDGTSLGSEVQSSLSVYDIEGNINKEFSATAEKPYGSYLSFNLNSSGLNELTKSLSAGNTATLSVDDKLLYVVGIDPYKSDLAIAIPFIQIKNTSLKESFLDITRALFSETKAFEYELKVDTQIQEVPAIYSPDGNTVLALLFMMSLGALCIFVLVKKGVRNSIAFGLMQIASVGLFLVLLKFLFPILSIYTIMCVFIFLLLSSLNAIYLINNKDETNRFKNLWFMFLIALIFATRLGYNTMFLTETLGIMLVASLTLLLCNYGIFNGLIELSKIKRYE